MRVLKCAKADVFNVRWNLEAAFSACRECNQLGLVFVIENTVGRGIVNVILAYNVALKLLKTDKGIFANVSYVSGNVESFDAGVVECVCIDAKVCSATESYGLKSQGVSKCGFTNSYNAIGNCNGCDLRACKGGFRNLRHRKSGLEGELLNAAAVEGVRA